MFERYQQNKQFKKDLPRYRFALTKWAWREKKSINYAVYQRLLIAESVELLIMDWERNNSFLPFNFAWFFITPPDSWIKKVLTWQ